MNAPGGATGATEATGLTGSIRSTEATEAGAACDRLLSAFERSLDLEAKGRASADDAIYLPLVQYALAQVRMRVRPALDPNWAADDSVHVVLFGGTNSGKSTVLNLLLGRAAAGMSALARFSQHPEAYRPAAVGDRWLECFRSRFAGYARYFDEHPPRQSDAELARGYLAALAVIDPERLAARKLAEPATVSAVLWDAPDFSTEEARAYMRAVLDLVALADVVLMTVTDQSYADERGNALLRMLVDSGVVLHVAANKVGDDPRLLRDIIEKVGSGVGSNLAGPPDAAARNVHRLPYVAGTTEEDRLAALVATPEAAQFRDALARDAAAGSAVKRRSLAAAVDFLGRRLDEVLRPLAGEASVATHWGQIVARNTDQILITRYASEYINGDRYGEFNQMLFRMMDLLEVPWVGAPVKKLRILIRKPMDWLTAKLFGRKKEKPPEEEILEKLFRQWLASLRGEAQALSSQHSAHPAWAGIAQKLGSSDFQAELAAGDFADGYATYREELEEEEKRRAQELYEILEKRPVVLNAARTFLFGLDVGALGVAIHSIGLDWSDLVVGPLILKLRRFLTEKGLAKYLETQKQVLADWQTKAMRGLVERGLAEPVRALFRGTVQPEEVEAARRDFATVKQAALRVAGGSF